MRSEMSGYKSHFETDLAEDLTETPARTFARKKTQTTRDRRASLMERILADARRGAREYAERWEAGRGAE